MSTPEPVLSRHSDHDPAIVCRPALGYGLCEVLEPDEKDESEDPSATRGSARHGR